MTGVPNEQQAEYWSEQGGPEWVRNEARYDTMLGAIGEDVLVAAALQVGDRVLDVGCGFGTMTVAAARAVAPSGVAVGVDISAPMIERAIGKAAGIPNVEFAVDDAQTMASHDPPFDVVISRMGVMFFDDPVAAFANLRATSAVDARLAFACWQSVASNRWLRVVAEVFQPYLSEPVPVPPPGAPGPMAFADDDHVRELLTAAGWQDVELVDSRRRLTISAVGIEGAMQQLLNASVGRVVTQLVPAEAREQALTALRTELEAHADGDIVTYDGAVWIVTARAST